MSADKPKPLHVRCAEVLGWNLLDEHAGTWVGLRPGVTHDLTNPGRPVYAPKEPVCPYGDDTPEGWACTGPLITRFGLCLTVNLGTWYAFDAATGAESDSASSAPEAAASWVVINARFVR